MTAFAAFESRVNASVLRHLANARVSIAGAEVDGIFRCPAEIVALGGGVADTRPTVTIASSAVPALPVDTEIAINGVPYIIAAAAPDGTGMTVLLLERTE